MKESKPDLTEKDFTLLVAMANIELNLDKNESLEIDEINENNHSLYCQSALSFLKKNNNLNVNGLSLKIEESFDSFNAYMKSKSEIFFNVDAEQTIDGLSSLDSDKYLDSINCVSKIKEYETWNAKGTVHNIAEYCDAQSIYDREELRDSNSVCTLLSPAHYGINFFIIGDNLNIQSEMNLIKKICHLDF